MNSEDIHVCQRMIDKKKNIEFSGSMILIVVLVNFYMLYILNWCIHTTLYTYIYIIKQVSASAWSMDPPRRPWEDHHRVVGKRLQVATHYTTWVWNPLIIFFSTQSVRVQIFHWWNCVSYKNIVYNIILGWHWLWKFLLLTYSCQNWFFYIIISMLSLKI